MDTTVTAQAGLTPFLDAIRMATVPLRAGRFFLRRLPRLLWRVAVMRRRHVVALRRVRGVFEVCDQACPDPVCLAKAHDMAAQALAGLRAMLPLLPPALWARPIRRVTEDLIVDWEDLSEDCAIASDAEIRDLLRQFSEAL